MFPLLTQVRQSLKSKLHKCFVWIWDEERDRRVRRQIPAAHMTHFEKLCVSFKILFKWNSLAEIKPQCCVQIMCFVQRSFLFL